MADVRPESMERITTEALAQAFIDEQIAAIKAQVGNKRVLLALSGGVDSSVVAALLIKAIGKNLVCVHVNHGLLRKGEPEQVIEVFRNQMDANLIYIDAVDRFLDKLAGVAEPERKRKIIGEEFIRVFEEEARKLEGIEFLAQGTIYPDILESGPVKSHHNVGGLPEDIHFEGLVEPLKLLFKDEVRMVGKTLGLPDSMVYRQPFPGPGLGVRCTGAITRERLELVRESDAILREEFANAGLQGKVWQYFTIVPDCKSVGLKNNLRSFENFVVIRAVNTVDAMTAAIEPIPYELLGKIVVGTNANMATVAPGVTPVNNACTLLSVVPAYRASFSRGEETDIVFRVRNNTYSVWSAEDLDIAYIGGENILKRKDQTRKDLPYDVNPGGTLEYGLDAIVPDTPGVYTMTMGVVRGYEILCTMDVTVQVVN